MNNLVLHPVVALQSPDYYITNFLLYNNSTVLLHLPREKKKKPPKYDFVHILKAIRDALQC